MPSLTVTVHLPSLARQRNLHEEAWNSFLNTYEAYTAHILFEVIILFFLKDI